MNDRTKYTVSESPVSTEGSSSQSQASHQDSQNSQLFAPEFVYPSDPEVGGAVVCRHNSSTRYSFLDIKDPFLSVSPAVFTDASEIPSDMEGECICKSGKAANECCAKDVDSGAVGGFDGEAVKAMWEAVKKIDRLSEKVIGLERQIDEQGEVIKELKE